MTTDKTKLCEVCNQPFQPTNNRQKYCPKCRQDAKQGAVAQPTLKRRSEEREREKKRSSAIWH